MDKVYIVTAGEYSDYHIVAVFSDPKQAEFCRTKEGYDAEVEEWDINPRKYEGKIWYQYECRVESGVIHKESCIATLNKSDNYIHQGLIRDWEGNKVVQYYDVCMYFDKKFDFDNEEESKVFDKIVFDYIAKDRAEKNEALGIE